MEDRKLPANAVPLWFPCERALEECQHRYRMLVDQAPQLYLLHDMAGDIVDVNRAALSQTGYSREELLALNVFDLDPDLAGRGDRENLWPTLTAEPVTMEVRHRRRDGSHYQAEVTVSAIDLTDGSWVMVWARDVTASKAAESSLQEARRLLQHVLDTIPVRVFWKDRNSRFLGCNLPFACDAGLESPEELLGKSDLEMAWRDQAALYRADDRLIMDSGEAKIGYEEPQTTPDGGCRWLRTSKVPLRNAAGLVSGILGTYEDITERKQAEEALRQSEARNRALLDAMPDLMFLCDGSGVFLDFHCDDATRLLLSPQEFLGKKAKDVLPPDVGPVVSAAIDAAVVSGGLQSVEYQMAIRGQDRHFESRIVRCGAHQALAIVRDVTERRRAEAEREASERRYRELFLSHPLPMLVFDNASLRIVAVNDAAVRKYGWTQEEFLTLTILDIRPPEDVPRLEAALAASPDRHGHREFVGWRHRGKDGLIFDVEVTSHDLSFHGRDVRVVVVHDVTERLRLELQVRQMQKMQAVGTLAGGVAHDFNNLLQAMLCAAEGARQRTSEPDVTGALEELDSYIRRGAALTRQLLLFSRQETTRRQLLDFNEVVADVMTMLLRLLPERITSVVERDSSPLPVEGDPSQLEQILVNLVLNARDAMASGGRLTVRTVRQGDEARLDIEDTGVGMSRELQERIFEPFFTTREQGTGMGLAVVHGIVTGHGGRIEVSTEEGRGSAFRVLLPLAPPPTQAETAVDRDSGTPVGLGEQGGAGGHPPAARVWGYRSGQR